MNPQAIPVNTPSSVATRFAETENVSRTNSSFQGVTQ